LKKKVFVNGRDVQAKNRKKRYKSHDRMIGMSRSVAGLPTSLKLAARNPATLGLGVLLSAEGTWQ
jgi:hypothetical protein